ncbi:MAG: hypothetical protein GY861_04935 [bacterium]|nr:hypothetical protein [bacterium]
MKDEILVLAMLKINELFPVRYLLNRSFFCFGYKVTFKYRAKNNLWGRFGGGWNWELGFQAGGSSLAINLLLMSISFHKKPKESNNDKE